MMIKIYVLSHQYDSMKYKMAMKLKKRKSEILVKPELIHKATNQKLVKMQ